MKHMNSFFKQVNIVKLMYIIILYCVNNITYINSFIST